jgi:hypothetical protein
MEKIPQPLIDEIAAGRCLVFVGAGFSLGARLPAGLSMPTWKELTRRLANELGRSSRRAGSALEVAEAFEREFGRVALIEAIRGALHPDEATPGPAHEALARFPFDTVYTTNFDLLLEAAWGQVKRPVRSLVGEKQLAFHGGPTFTTIIKMHGDLNHQESIVATAADYASFIGQHPVLATHLSAMLITRTPLFLGYSLSDPDFNQIRDVVMGRLGQFLKMAYVVQFDAAPSARGGWLKKQVRVLGLTINKTRTRTVALTEFLNDLRLAVDAANAAQPRVVAPQAFEPVAAITIRRLAKTEDSPSLLASTSNICFVISSFAPESDAVFRLLIAPVAQELELTTLRAMELLLEDGESSTGEKVRSAIMQSRVVVADLTGQAALAPNSNVLYELGLAESVGKPLVILVADSEQLPTDLQGQRYVRYDPKNADATSGALRRELTAALGIDRLAIVDALIDGGRYRAAAAELGVVLEYSLRSRVDRLSLEAGTGYRSSRDLIQWLEKRRAITRETARELMRAVTIRNRAVHRLLEPSETDVRQMRDVVGSFVSHATG